MAAAEVVVAKALVHPIVAVLGTDLESYRDSMRAAYGYTPDPASIVLIMALVPALFEELGFRAGVQTILEPSIGSGEAALVAAHLFAFTA